MQAQTHRGKASYYSKRATGARTASGERLHHDSLTCAHRNYPFGTLLKVKNLSNGKEITVKVTDRGPYGRGRIIDLSYGAARELGMLSQGVAMVEVRRADGSNPPYRMDDETERGLPDFEFDFSKAAYSFIKDWKDNDEDEDKGLTKEEMVVKRKMPTQKQAQEKRQRILAKSNQQATADNKEEDSKTKESAANHKTVMTRSATKAPHTAVKPNTATRAKQHANGNKEKDPSFWSSVFDHVKGWFGN